MAAHGGGRGDVTSVRAVAPPPRGARQHRRSRSRSPFPGDGDVSGPRPSGSLAQGAACAPQSRAMRRPRDWPPWRWPSCLLTPSPGSGLLWLSWPPGRFPWPQPAVATCFLSSAWERGRVVVSSSVWLTSLGAVPSWPSTLPVAGCRPFCGRATSARVAVPLLCPLIPRDPSGAPASRLS